MSDEKSIPLAEFRREGYKLFFANTSLTGLILAALLASALIVLAVAVLLWLFALLNIMFSFGVSATGFASGWGAFAELGGRNIGSLLLMPFFILQRLWPLDLVLSLLFCLAVIPQRYSFRLRLEHERGRPGGSLPQRHLPFFIFWTAFTALFLLPMLPYFQDTVPLQVLRLPLDETVPALTGAAILIIAFITALLMEYIWNWALFQGLKIYHFLLVRDERCVTRKRISRQFTESDS